jgi:AcrR family transcriptional regulator
MGPRKTKNPSRAPAPRQPLRRSTDAVKDATLAAAYEQLTEVGLAGVSVDEVSRISGVAKTTIYRHWPTRAALLLDACIKCAPRVQVPETGSLKGDLLAVASEMARRLRTEKWASALPSVIDAAERDADIADLQKRQHAGMMAVFGAIAENAIRRGDVAARPDVSELTALIAGPLFYRRWFSRQQIDERFVRSIVEKALAETSNKPYRQS